uniref:Palmitoyltransferase n=1 Tax=Lotharella oceanica TaxID=641309 RepID=A0A7S2TVW8_9EUKA
MDTVGEDELQLRGGGDTKGGTCKRMWEVFPGKNLICCGGRCITGPDPSIFVFNIVLTFGALALFYAFIAIRLHPIVIVIGFILHGISFYFLLRAAFTDPGILRRRKTPTRANENGDPPTAVVNGKTVQLSYCTTCNIYRPPKCKHCRTCDNCVEEFDHHCPWVMNCVAKRNYRYFVGFVASISLLCVYVCACSIAIVVISVTGNRQPAGVTLCAIVLILFTGCLGVTLSGFACFHCGLIAQGITTNEYIKGRAGGARETGCSQYPKNCYEVYCTELPKPDVNLMGPADEEMRDRGGSDEKMVDLEVRAGGDKDAEIS